MATLGEDPGLLSEASVIKSVESFIQHYLLEHFSAYSEWPWNHFNDPFRQLQEHPAFLVGEVMFILLGIAACMHAVSSSSQGGSSSVNAWLLVLTLLAGIANDYIFMILPVVDNFWQAQAVIMLTPRMPLYIPCVYVCFMYWPLVCSRRVMDCLCPRDCEAMMGMCRNVAQACLTGLLSCIFYAPYDVCGARFLWWTWHHDDAPIRDRWLGVPCGSTMFTICLPAALSFLFQLGADRGWSRWRTSVVVCSCSTLLMVVVMNIPILIATPMQPGTPTRSSLVLMILVFIMGFSFFGSLATQAPASRTSKGPRPLHPFLVSALAAYFFTFVAVMVYIDPVAQISTGAHQAFGPCNVTDVDLMQQVRKRYNCAQDYPRWYFRLWAENATGDAGTGAGETPSRWKFVDPVQVAKISENYEAVTWYTILGQPHESYETWVAAEFALALLGSVVFVVAATIEVRDSGSGDGIDQGNDKPDGASGQVRSHEPEPELMASGESSSRPAAMQRRPASRIASPGPGSRGPAAGAFQGGKLSVHGGPQGLVKRQMLTAGRQALTPFGRFIRTYVIDGIVSPLVDYNFHIGVWTIHICLWASLFFIGAGFNKLVPAGEFFGKEGDVLKAPYNFLKGLPGSGTVLFGPLLVSMLYAGCMIFYSLLDLWRPGSASLKKLYIIQPREGGDFSKFGFLRPLLQQLKIFPLVAPLFILMATVKGPMPYRYPGIAMCWSNCEPIALPETAPPLAEFLLHVGFCLWVHDFHYYLFHWMLHRNNILYKRIHAMHHEYVAPFALVTAHGHPYEILSVTTAFAILAPYTCHAHPLTTWVAISVGMLAGVEAHVGYRYHPLWFVLKPLTLGQYGGAESHDVHHQRISCNFQPFFKYLDTLCGTGATEEQFVVVPEAAEASRIKEG